MESKLEDYSVFDVYGDDENWFFSFGITRDFGENKIVTLNCGKTVFTVVVPANDYVQENLPIVGTMKVKI